MKRIALLLFVLIVSGCPKTSDPVPPPVGPPPEDSDPSKCADACAVIALKCPKTKLAEDRSCVDSCKQIESSGYLTIHPKCIADAVDAQGVRACNFDCKE